jgi:hypothetical protein
LVVVVISGLVSPPSQFNESAARSASLEVDIEGGERKEDIAHEYLAEHDGAEGVLFVGRAQEKTNVLRTQRRRNPVTGKAYPWLVPDTAMVNHFYFLRHEVARCERARRREGRPMLLSTA